MKIAYLVNQYPMPSQSFIRREVLALEQLGLNIDRYTVRQYDGTLVDPGDLAERDKTRVILDVGGIGLLTALLTTMLTRPAKFFAALRTAITHGRRAGSGVPLHVIYLAEACVLRKWLAERQTQHVHTHFGTNSTTVALLCRQLGGPPYSFTSHGPEEYYKAGAISLGDKVRHCAFVVGISQFGRSQLFHWSRYEDWSKIEVVRCGVDAMFLSTPPTPIPNTTRLVNVARLGPEKGQLIAIRALKKLIDEGVDAMLTLVGDGKLRPQLEQAIGEFGLTERVTITGWAPNERVRQEILAARALLMPSFAEGLPVVVMEALALRRPVIGTYIAGMPELVEPGISGWLVPAGDVDKLADAMRQVLEASTETLEAMGAAGAAAVAERHDANKEAARLAVLFRRTIGTN